MKVIARGWNVREEKDEFKFLFIALLLCFSAYFVVVKKFLTSRILAEQIRPMNARPLSVSLLAWSHSAFVSAVLQYVEMFNSFQKSRA